MFSSFICTHEFCSTSRKQIMGLESEYSKGGVKRLKQSDCYIMKCPVIMSRRGQECVYCQPTFIQLKGSES